MTFVRRNSSEDLSPLQCSPVYSNNNSPITAEPKEALHYLSDFLDAKLGVGSGVNGGYFSRSLQSSPFKLQELKVKDVLEQELKMKEEQTTKGTCSNQWATRQTMVMPPVATVKTEKTTEKPSKKRPASPDSDSDSNKSSGRRFRTHFTPTQLDLLETTFHASKYPSSSLRQQVHEMTGIPKDNIKVWFQNRRAREKRRKEKSNRLVLPSARSTDAPVTTTQSSQEPVAMTTMNMHWPEDSRQSTNSTTSSVPTPRYHPYQNQWNTPAMHNRRNWYWANAYQPMEPPCSSLSPPTTSTATLPSVDSFRSLDGNHGMPLPLPQIPAHESNFVASNPVPFSIPDLPVSVASNSFVNPNDMHPWTDNVLKSL